MDALTRMYADSWAQLPIEVVALALVPRPRDAGDEADGRPDDAPGGSAA